MKNTKRILATLMTIIMLVGLLAVPAMAANITIKDTNNDNYYTIYKIFDYDATNSADGKPLFKPADGWENFSADSYFTLLNGYVVWESGSDAATGAAFAAVAKDYVVSNSPTAVAGATQVSSQVVTFTGLDQGYYLILVTDENGAYKDGTTCGVVAVLDDVSINAKDTATGLPIVEKKVYDDDLTAPDWAASNSVEIGSTVQFQTTVTAKVATAAYALHDTMAAGFTFNNDVSVTLNGTPVDTANYSVTTTTDDSCSFHVTFTDDFCKKLHSNDSIVVSYTATLNDTAATAETNTTGNNNEVYLSYTENSTAKSTDPATTTTYTYQIKVAKTDGTNPLAGAEFQLKNAEGKFVNVDSSGYFIKWDTTGSTLSGTDGKFSIIGLDAGEYTLVETKAPAGYIKAKDTTIQIIDANKEVEVVNTAGVELPETGGMGTTLFYVAGGALVLGAFVLLMKKRSGQK